MAVAALDLVAVGVVLLIIAFGLVYLLRVVGEPMKSSSVPGIPNLGAWIITQTGPVLRILDSAINSGLDTLAGTWGAIYAAAYNLTIGQARTIGALYALAARTLSHSIPNAVAVVHAYALALYNQATAYTQRVYTAVETDLHNGLLAAEGYAATLAAEARALALRLYATATAYAHALAAQVAAYAAGLTAQAEAQATAQVLGEAHLARVAEQVLAGDLAAGDLRAEEYARQIGREAEDYAQVLARDLDQASLQRLAQALAASAAVAGALTLFQTQVRNMRCIKQCDVLGGLGEELAVLDLGAVLALVEMAAHNPRGTAQFVRQNVVPLVRDQAAFVRGLV